ncbi:MAG: ABC transporter permease [Bdellovibrionales bacterium]|nr:ABC transporter permease [Bdellovibrionales bacterium]NQZ18076.1 ABC transporter permease [Bdellovibrionales bacterium]
MTQLLTIFLKLEWSIARGYPLKIILNFFHISMIVILFFYISQTLGEISILNGDYFPFVASGLAFQYFFSGTLHASSSKVLEWRDLGLLENLVYSGRKAWKIYLSAGAYDMAMAFTKGLIVTLGIFYLASPSFHAPLLSLTLLTTLAMILPLSLIATCSFLLWKRVSIIEVGGNIWALFLSGVYFPIDVLPSWIQPLAIINPLYHGLLLFRKSLGIHSPDQALTSTSVSFLILAAWTLAAGVFSVLFYKYSQKELRRNGGLSHH